MAEILVGSAAASVPRRRSCATVAAYGQEKRWPARKGSLQPVGSYKCGSILISCTVDIGHHKKDLRTQDSSNNRTVKMTCSYAEKMQISVQGLCKLAKRVSTQSPLFKKAFLSLELGKKKLDGLNQVHSRAVAIPK